MSVITDYLDFLYTQTADSPAISWIFLSPLSGVQAYEVRYEAGIAWSTFQEVLPETYYAVPAGVNGIEFAPLDFSGHHRALIAGESVTLQITYATRGQVTGTLSASAQIPSPVGLTLSSSSDSGIKGDNTTDIPTPVITGLGEGGDTVTLFDGTMILGTVVVADDGTWSITTNTLAPGVHSLWATETDTAQNVSAASTALNVTITNPAPGDLTNPAPADFNGDGKSDILLQNDSGEVFLWEMNGVASAGAGSIGNPGPSWHATATGDFNGDGKSDILLQNDSGEVSLWEMNGLTGVGAGSLGNPGPSWHATATGDFNGDGKSDILLQNNSGEVFLWEMNGLTGVGGGSLGNPGPSWHAII
jgi:hypothetical protein